MLDQNKSLVRRFVDEIWNKGNTGKLEEFLSAQYSAQTSDGTINGPKEYRQFHDTYLKAFPDSKLTIDELVAEADTVFVRCTYSGTQSGEFRGIPPSGKKVREQVMVILRIADGKISQEVSAWDRLSLLEQLGEAPELMKRGSKKSAGNR